MQNRRAAAGDVEQRDGLATLRLQFSASAVKFALPTKLQESNGLLLLVVLLQLPQLLLFAAKLQENGDWRHLATRVNVRPDRKLLQINGATV